MKKNKNKKVISNELISNDTFLTLYIHFLYKFIGRRLLLIKKFKTFFYKNIYNKKYENILKKANMKILPEEYFMSIYITITFFIIFIFVVSISFIFINSIYSILIFYGGILLLMGFGIFIYNYPIIISRDRGKEIDASLPYLLPYMQILAKEVNLTKIIEIIDEFLIYKEIKIEFRKIKYYYSFLGYDIHSSIREAMSSCPSRDLADIMNDLVAISNSGGNIYSYLSRKLENLNDEIVAIEKKNIDTLLIFSQIYVVILLISPLFFTIMSSVLNMVEFSTNEATTNPNSVNSTIILIVGLLMLLPIAYGLFMILIYYTRPLYSRLKPLKNEN